MGKHEAKINEYRASMILIGTGVVLVVGCGVLLLWWCSGW